MALLKGKRALVVGVASKHSIAYSIAESFAEHGATIGLTYQNEKLKDRVNKMGDIWNSDFCIQCDVSSDDDIESLRKQIDDSWGGVDIIVHSVGYAPAEELAGSFIEGSTREGFRIAQDISCYSFIALAKVLKPLLPETGGSLITLTYHGSQQTLPNYNVMGLAKASLEASVRYLATDLGPLGVRVNSISAGPIKTLAASGIKSFRKMLKKNSERAALQRNISAKEVANTATFLSSDMASGITGQNIYVDAGFNICAISNSEMLDS